MTNKKILHYLLPALAFFVVLCCPYLNYGQEGFMTPAQREALIQRGIREAPFVFEGIPVGAREYRQAEDASAVYTVLRFEVVRWLKCPEKAWQKTYVEMAIPGGVGPDISLIVHHGDHLCGTQALVFAVEAVPAVPRVRGYRVLQPWQDLSFCLHADERTAAPMTRNRRHQKPVLPADSIAAYVRAFREKEHY
ncbi:MAG: hypothetical protein F6K11_10935 [Leptolyngbya sp. SIO3F4]|nr:hypothetical protein [Leptolyngbya sp. SIO3F4]